MPILDSARPCAQQLAQVLGLVAKASSRTATWAVPSSCPARRSARRARNSSTPCPSSSRARASCSSTTYRARHDHRNRHGPRGRRRQGLRGPRPLLASCSRTSGRHADAPELLCGDGKSAEEVSAKILGADAVIYPPRRGPLEGARDMNPLVESFDCSPDGRVRHGATSRPNTLTHSTRSRSRQDRGEGDGGRRRLKQHAPALNDTHPARTDADSL